METGILDQAKETYLVNNYDIRLVYLGYDLSTRNKIIEGGLADYLARRRDLEDKGGNSFINAKETEVERAETRMPSMTCCYKAYVRKQRNHAKREKDKRAKLEQKQGREKEKKVKGEGDIEEHKRRPDTFLTLFINGTVDSKLIELLKAREAELSPFVGFHTKDYTESWD